MSGYIKLYRATCDHPLFKRDMAYLGAWAWLLSQAAWKPHQAKHRKTITYELQVGDLPGGRAYLADQWGWTEKKVRTFLDCLARHNMVSISQLKGQRLAIITICNYSKFQHSEIKEGQQRAEEGPTKGHTEEGKELRERKNISLEIEASFEEFWSAYPRKTGKAQALKKFTAIISSGHATPEQLISAAKARVGITSTDQKFIPFAATWLNQARWSDVESKVSGAASKKLDEYYRYEAENDPDADDARNGHHAQGLCGRQAFDDVPELFELQEACEPQETSSGRVDRSQGVAGVLHPLRVEGGAV